jgi:hypothetical protein
MLPWSPIMCTHARPCAWTVTGSKRLPVAACVSSKMQCGVDRALGTGCPTVQIHFGRATWRHAEASRARMALTAPPAPLHFRCRRRPGRRQPQHPRQCPRRQPARGRDERPRALRGVHAGERDGPGLVGSVRAVRACPSTGTRVISTHMSHDHLLVPARTSAATGAGGGGGGARRACMHCMHTGGS